MTEGLFCTVPRDTGLGQALRTSQIDLKNDGSEPASRRTSERTSVMADENCLPSGLIMVPRICTYEGAVPLDQMLVCGNA